MKIFYFLIMCCHNISGKLSEVERIEYCRTLECDETFDEKVCGIRKENGKNTYNLFNNECILLKYGCQVDDYDAYGITNLEKCNEYNSQENDVKTCPDCVSVQKDPVCGIRSDGNGFRVRIFASKCQLNKFNCEQEQLFYATNFYICVDQDNSTRRQNDEDYEELLRQESEKDLHEGIETFNEIDDVVITSTSIAPQNEKKTIFKNIVVVGGSLSDMMNINDTVKNFFAATHVLDLPVREIPANVDQKTRRMLIRVFGPIKVFTPWLKIPENITDDYYHKPTLSSCFHKCPTFGIYTKTAKEILHSKSEISGDELCPLHSKCPDTYAPVCGVPGIVAREPSLMFQNHCFMDVAQCKMFWEDKSWTAESSAYIESSFLFCLGDELYGLYRFLPLIRTLQHMGHLRSKGHFKHKMKNMRFFNQLLNRQPNLMG